MLTKREIKAIKLLSATMTEGEIAAKMDIDIDDWMKLKLKQKSLCAIFSDPVQMPTSKQLLAAKELRDKPTPPPRPEWSGWGTDPDLAARNIVREFERTHGMECGTDEHQSEHKGMSDRLRRR